MAGLLGSGPHGDGICLVSDQPTGLPCAGEAVAGVLEGRLLTYPAWPWPCLSFGCGPNQALPAAIWGWGSGTPQGSRCWQCLGAAVVHAGTDAPDRRTLGEV